MNKILDNIEEWLLCECHCQIHIQRVFVLLRRDHDLPLRPAEPSGRGDLCQARCASRPHTHHRPCRPQSGSYPGNHFDVFCNCIISVLLAMQLLSTAAYAAGIIDLDRDVRLTVSYQDGNTPLAGAGFSIYLVATADESGELTTTDAFKQFNVDIRGKNDEAWKALASTLEGYVLRDDIAPTDSGKTNAEGYLYFPTGGRLTPGLYLVLGQRHIQNGPCSADVRAAVYYNRSDLP